MPQLLLIDDLRHRMGPLSDLHSSFEWRASAWTNRGRIERLIGRRADAVFVAPELEPVASEREPTLAVNAAPMQDSLLVNGALLRTDGAWRALPIGHGLLDAQGRVVALHARAGDLSRAIACFRGGERAGRWSFAHSGDTLIARPWDIIANLPLTLNDDLRLLASDWPDNGSPTLPASVARVGDHPVLLSPGATLGPFVVLDATRGAIHVGQGAKIGALSVLHGPCTVGDHATLAPHTQLRPGSVLADHASAGGEVSQSILGEHAHKSHAGYLGHSIVCSFANLGADTNVSNLKNTFGTVRVQLSADAPPEETGQLKLGSLIGHFTKTAIGSRLPTGACISTAVMLGCDGFAPRFVSRFRFLTPGADAPYRVDAFLETTRIQLDRKSLALGPALEARLRDLAR